LEALALKKMEVAIIVEAIRVADAMEDHTAKADAFFEIADCEVELGPPHDGRAMERCRK
jgi:hypothetical protein